MSGRHQAKLAPRMSMRPSKTSPGVVDPVVLDAYPDGVRCRRAPVLPLVADRLDRELRHARVGGKPL